MKPLLLLRDCGQTTCCPGHLPKYCRDGRLSKCERGGSILRTLHRSIVARYLPGSRPGERLCNIFLIDSERVLSKTVKNDFKLGRGKREELRDDAIGVAKL